MRLRIFLGMIDEILALLQAPRLIRNFSICRVHYRPRAAKNLESVRMFLDVPCGPAGLRGFPDTLHVRFSIGRASEGRGSLLCSARRNRRTAADINFRKIRSTPLLLSGRLD